MNRFLTPTIIFTMLLAIGCRPNAPHGEVAVVNLDTIARAMGWTDQMSTELESAARELQSQLEQVAQEGRAKVDQAKQEVIEAAKLNADQIATLNQIVDLRDLEKLPLSETQRKKLIDTLNESNLALQNARNSFQPALQQHRLEIIRKYRERVYPIAKQVAQDRGLKIVLTPNDGILYFDADQVEITAEVIRRLRE